MVVWALAVILLTIIVLAFAGKVESLDYHDHAQEFRAAGNLGRSQCADTSCRMGYCLIVLSNIRLKELYSASDGARNLQVLPISVNGTKGLGKWRRRHQRDGAYEKAH